jgi:hypothetical protein
LILQSKEISGRAFERLDGGAEGEGIPLSLAGGSTRWFSPWDREPRGFEGSYFYEGEWEAIDHFLLPWPPLGDDYESSESPAWPSSLDFRVAAKAFQLDDGGIPARYDSRTGAGFSDHLPLVLEMGAPAEN